MWISSGLQYRNSHHCISAFSNSLRASNKEEMVRTLEACIDIKFTACFSPLTDWSSLSSAVASKKSSRNLHGNTIKQNMKRNSILVMRFTQSFCEWGVDGDTKRGSEGVCMLFGGALDIKVLYCTVLHCTVLYCTVLYCTVLYCTVLYCTVLYCTVLTSSISPMHSDFRSLLLHRNQLYER